MTKYLTRIASLAMMLLSFASVMYANPLDCAATPSNPSCAPTLSIAYQIGNGNTQNITSFGTPLFSGGNWNVNFTPQSFGGALFTGGQLAANADPFVGFSFGVINVSSQTLTFSYDFTTPYAGGPYGFVQSVFGDVLIDTRFQGTSTVTPVSSLYIMNTLDSGNLLSQVGIGKGCTTVNFVCTSPDDGQIGPLPYTSFASGTLEVKGSFTLTTSSQYTLTGRSDLVPTPSPEPGTLLMLGTGIIGAIGAIRRKINL
jgi:hypothetical protein